MAKLKEQDFLYWKAEVKRWMKFFGLFEWDCRFLFEKDKENLATASWDAENGIAVFSLATHWGKDPLSPYLLSKTAFHEACEILLAKLDSMALTNWTEWKVREATHRIIRKLENTVFEDEWNRRHPVPEGI